MLTPMDAARAPIRSHSSDWILQAMRIKEARGDATAQASADRNAKELMFTSGVDEHGRYTWSQTIDDVEVRVTSGIPSGPSAKKRTHVSYGRGESLQIDVDGDVSLQIDKLFDRVTPDDCSWCLDRTIDGRTTLVVTMEKVESRPWVELALPTLQLAP